MYWEFVYVCVLDVQRIIAHRFFQKRRMLTLFVLISRKIYDDSESIQKILSEIATGKRTEKQSIQDYPSAEEYGTINIENNGGMTTMFYYEENGKYYIECPYKGIYEIENNFEDMI